MGVQCQYTSTTGRIENAQVATYLAYATSKGRVLVGREVYVLKSWADAYGKIGCHDSDGRVADRERRRVAGMPDGGDLHHEDRHARQMLSYAINEGVPANWATAHR